MLEDKYIPCKCSYLISYLHCKGKHHLRENSFVGLLFVGHQPDPAESEIRQDSWSPG